MSNQYCLGINHMPLTEKLAKGDPRWYEFNHSFDNLSVSPADLADYISMGCAYTSWHDPNNREACNWQLSQYIAVDMDTKDSRSDLTVVRRNDLVMMYGSLLHTTPSHTPQEPRCRIVFLLDRPITNPTAYANANKFLTEIMGGDPAATDPSRFFYGNQGGQVELVGKKLPVSDLQSYYNRHYKGIQRAQAGGNGGPHQKYQHRYTPERSHKSPREQNSVERIRKALDRIQPWDLAYLDWCAVIAAIKQELGDAGLGLAIQWADGKEGEVERMWRSFRRQSGNISALGTIIFFAYGAKTHGNTQGRVQ